MKKTLTINLNNTVFHIDDDAYELLQSYLNEVGHHFKSEAEKTDIMNDIEARIEELFSEKMDKQKNVITIEDVDTVITIMGKPSQFTDDETEEETKKQEVPTDSTKKKTHKKYYRDVDNQLLSGVAAGLAAYLNWDIAIVRIIFVVLAFVTSGTFVLIYLLMWLIVPKAETTAQKLEMHGEDVNIETIKNKMVDAKEYLESEKFRQEATATGNRIWSIVRGFLKVLFTLIVAIISVVGVVLIAALILALILFLLEPEAITSISPEFFTIFGDASPDKVIILLISLLLIIGCPIFVLMYWTTRVLSNNKKTGSSSGIWIAGILWLAGIFMFIGTGAETLKKLKQHNIISYDFQSDNPDYTTDVRNVANFNAIETSGAIEVELTQQDNQTVSISTLREYLPNVKTEVVDGTLKIYSTDNLIKPNIRVKIGIDSINRIEARGASKIDFTNSFTQKNLNINLRGASKADVKLNSAQKLVFDIQGMSKIDINGAVDTLSIKGDGASKIDAGNLNSKVVNIEMNGASRAEVFASDSFNGHAFGASKITVKGNPAKRTNEFNPGSSIQYE
ncbi:MAG: GIN domain-containing protein [Paludibacteraceae bacterium]